jgi:ribosomal protein S18 acetylase RimI-like enzyme
LIEVGQFLVYDAAMPAFEFRPTGKSDFAFCWPIYREAMEPLTAALGAWNEPAQRRLVEETLSDEGASILIAEKSDSGWLHVSETRFIIHLSHIYLEPAARNHGLGTKFMTWMNERAKRKDKDFTLELLKNNRARHLYERLGFRVTGTSGVKLTMQHQG